MPFGCSFFEIILVVSSRQPIIPLLQSIGGVKLFWTHLHSHISLNPHSQLPKMLSQNICLVEEDALSIHKALVWNKFEKINRKIKFNISVFKKNRIINSIVLK